MNFLHKISSSNHPSWYTHAIGVAVLLMTTLPIHFFCYLPQIERMESNQELARQLQSELNEADVVRREYRILSNAVTEAVTATSNRQEIPTSPFDTQFLGEVSEIAAELGIKIDDFQRGEISVGPLFSNLKITVRFESNYSAICQFFQRVSELPYLARLHRLEIVADIKRNDYPVVAEFELCFQSEPDTPPPHEIAFRQ